MDARFGSKPGGYLWALFDPASQVIMMTLIFGAIGRAPALGTSFPMFFATGYLAFNFYVGMSSYVVGAVKANKALLSYPVVAPIDTVAVIILIAEWEANKVFQVDFGPVVAAAAAASVLGLGVGLVNVTLFSRYTLYEKIFSIINRPMYLISGVFFLPDDMPHPFRDIILMNPVAHVIMWFRTGFYSEYHPSGLDRLFVVETSIILVLIGMILLTISSGHLRSDMG
jgi:capsular polysaccharide transport system permease protein